MNERTPLPPLEPRTLKERMQVPIGARELGTLLLQMLVAAAVGGFAMFLVMRSGLRLAPSGTPVPLVLLVACVSLVVSLLLHLVAHEAGHAWVGQRLGGLVLRVIIGPWRWERRRSGFRRTRERSLKGIDGLAQTVLPDGPRFLRDQVLMLLGGPGANLALAGLAWLALPLLPGWPLRMAATVFVAVGLLIGLVNLLPLHSGGFRTDGLQLLQICTDPEALELRRRMLRLARASIDGLRPREIDPGDLAALDISAAQGLEKLAAQMLHAAVAHDRGELAAMRALLEPALADWATLPDGLRQSLALLAALLAVEQDRDPVAAREWLLRTEAGLVHAFEVEWVRAGIAGLEGDAVARAAALARMRSALDETIYRGDERVWRERLDMLPAG